MQHSSALFVLFAVLAVPAASVNAMSQANLFMRNHGRTPPSTDELAELKGVNPEAYALVKALLTKRSLGLLDPSHPTASFAHAGQQRPQAAEQGPEAFAKLASPEELQAHSHHAQALVAEVATPYAEVASSGHHDFLNWKPSTANDDETMVNNVLGAVAELSGKKGSFMSKRHSVQQESTLAADEQSFAVPEESAPVVAAPKVSAPPAPKISAPPAASQENSYLKSIDLGVSSPEVPKPSAPAAHKKNSYLDGLDLTGDMPVQSVDGHKKTSQTSQAQTSSANYLASFSWDDSKPKEEQRRPKLDEPMKVDSKNANLLSWLGVVHQEPAVPQTQGAPAAPYKPSNPYLADLASD